MSQPQILDLQGENVQLHVFRGMSYTFLAEFKNADGTVVPLTDKSVVLKIADRQGGTLMYMSTTAPGAHLNAAAGQSLVSIPASAMASLTGPRAYTWKYTITTVQDITLDELPWFHGDLRIALPETEV